MTDVIIEELRIIGDVDPKDPRVIKGRSIAQENFERIVELKPGLWKVPSASGGGFYLVDLNEEYYKCDCGDSQNRNTLCKHYYAVRYVKSRTKRCVSCTRRFLFSDTIEVHDCEHPAYYPGDRLCLPCSNREGIY